MQASHDPDLVDSFSERSPRLGISNGGGLQCDQRCNARKVVGDPMGQLGSWAALLAAFALVYWSLGGILFQLAVEE